MVHFVTTHPSGSISPISSAQVRLIRELMPLDYIDINTVNGVVTYAKKKGTNLLEIQFSRRGMCSDHVIVAYRQRLEEGSVTHHQ